MGKLQERCYTEKDKLNAWKEEKVLKDLQFLKDQANPGPFNYKEDVRKLRKSYGDEKVKTEML